MSAAAVVHARDRLRLRVYIAFACAFVAFAATCAAVLWYRHDDELAAGRVRAENLALILTAHFRSSVDAIDATFKQLNLYSQRIGGPGAAAELWSPVLAAALSGLPEIGSLSVVSEDGVITHSTDPAIVGESRRDLFSFKHLAENPRAEIVADEPYFGRVTQRMFIPLARRLTSAEGKFAGIVAATLEPGRLRAFYRAVDVGPRGVVWVLHPTGRILFREPSAADPIGQLATENPLFAAQRAEPAAGFLRAPIEAGGETYLTAYRSSANPPIVTAVSLSERDRLANWRQEALVLGLVLLGLAASLFIAAVLFGRASREGELGQARLVEAEEARAAAARRLEEANAILRASQARFQAIMDYAPAEFIVKDLEGRYTFVNRSFERRVGKPSEQILGKTAADLFAIEYADLQHDVDRTVIAGRKPVQREIAADEPAGKRTVLMIKFPLFDGRGAVEAIGSITSDVTEQRHAEAQLAHAQKMEAVGQLTGGIAHDFNNLLTVILGNAELLVEQSAAEERALAELMMQAAERGAELTRRLLAFGRRQVLEPRLTDVNELVNNMEPLLRRAIDERVSIDLKQAPRLWRTRIDPGQLETAILNLAVNARDAMPNGGRLTIESANAELDENYALMNPEVAAGEYVLIAIEDSGSGMPPDVVARVFEPFFTTKEVGKGTGLGLSMVYGFVKQSGGHVKIYSEVGHGTVIKIFLPRAHEDIAADTGSVKIGDDILPIGSESVLLVEDDALVRANTQAQLKMFGYRVTVAENAIVALKLVDGGFVPDMVLTDIVMPGGMNGQELATKLRERWPDLKVLFTSGYAHGATSELLNGNGAHFIGKPFRRRTLALKMREVLDEDQPRARNKGAA